MTVPEPQADPNSLTGNTPLPKSNLALGQRETHTQIRRKTEQVNPHCLPRASEQHVIKLPRSFVASGPDSHPGESSLPTKRKLTTYTRTRGWHQGNDSHRLRSGEHTECA